MDNTIEPQSDISPDSPPPLIHLSKEAIAYEQAANFRTMHTKWRNYTRDLPSPDSFIDFGFYYLIGCCLQRRVWTGASHEPIFPNQMQMLVADPGIGKGRVTDVISDVLHYHYLPLRNTHAVEREELDKKGELKDRQMAEGTELYNKQVIAEGRPDMVIMSEDNANKKESPTIDRPLLFPIAADATSYQALIKAIAKAKRRKDVAISPLCKNGIYTHSSICFILDELSSLLRKQTEDTVNFLVQAYGCKDYKYETIGRGIDIIQKCCVSLIAGTTPDFVNRVFKADLVGQGWASRSWFIFEFKNRFVRPIPSELDEEQKTDYTNILARAKELSTLYGYCKLSPEAEKFYKDYITDFTLNPRSNYNHKLKDYYARLGLHILKLAMAIHFADSNEMELPKGAIIKAIDMLDSVHDRMHFALSADKGNPLAKVSDEVLKHLRKSGSQTFTELHFAFWDDLKESELRELLNAQVSFGNIVGESGEYRIAKKNNNL